jgi:hypothetical protein
MTVLVYTTTVQPAAGPRESTGINLTVSGTLISFNTYRQRFQAGDSLGGTIIQSTAITSILNSGFNGGTFGPAKGGTTVSSNSQFIWGSITSF